MSNRSNDKKYQIVTELGEEKERSGLVQAMEHLDRYTVITPSAQSTEELITYLKPILQEEPSMAQDDAKAISVFPDTAIAGKKASGFRKLPAILQLLQPQAMLLSRWFVVLSVLIFITGLAIIKAINGNMLLFLADASPVLGILTIYYEFRANLSGTAELEATCPYSPAQLAAARLLVVLTYDIVLCLAATPFVSYFQGQMLWQVIISWFAPLLLILGVALSMSLRFGITSGCLVATIVWVLQVAASEKGPMNGLLLPKKMEGIGNFIIMGIGALLLLYTCLQWKSISAPFDNKLED